MSIRYFIFSIIFLLANVASSQVVELKNKSFEGIPRQGGAEYPFHLDHWDDCGQWNFKTASPPDVHPGGFWANNYEPSDGRTYLGLVGRPSGSYESVSQKLSEPLVKNKCYAFAIDLALGESYQSGTIASPQTPVNFDEPLVLKIWGSSTSCYKMHGGKNPNTELLAQSVPIANNYWQQYIFTIEPKKTHTYLTFEVFFANDAEDPYPGNVLLDNATDFFPIECDDDIAIIDVFTKDLDDVVAYNESLKEKKKPINSKAKKKPVAKEVPIKKEEPAVVVAVEQPKQVEEKVIPKAKNPEEIILTELDAKTIKKGQIINVKKLFFAADTSSISEDSHEVLDEIYTFLNQNKQVIIEVGGHTNTIPPHEFCDKLSTERAKSVASYLIAKGIPASRIKFKGYGKRQPLNTKKTASARAMNQRVEIKILST